MFDYSRVSAGSDLPHFLSLRSRLSTHIHNSYKTQSAAASAVVSIEDLNAIGHAAELKSLIIMLLFS